MPRTASIFTKNSRKDQQAKLTGLTGRTSRRHQQRRMAVLAITGVNITNKVHCKKGLLIFQSPDGMSLTYLVSDIPAGGKPATFSYNTTTTAVQ
jgi:hypothetical protein